MRELPVDATRAHWQALWEGSQIEVLKIGVLSDYSEGQDGKLPSLQLWMAGDPEAGLAAMETETLGRRNYPAMCRERREAGVAVRRVDYIEYPLTPYQEWMYTSLQRRCVPEGEELLQVEPADVPDLVLPEGDVVIFDNRDVVAYQYQGLGRLVGSRVYSAATDNIGPIIAFKSVLLDRAEPVPPLEL